MSTTMRAKFVLDTILRGPTSETLNFRAVSTTPFGPNGSSEDNTYARFTPMASCQMQITNPDLLGKFKPGDSYYVDFTPVPAPARVEEPAGTTAA